jgi:ATPase subunit of ABC transporter with duplicated ATPase domains
MALFSFSPCNFSLSNGDVLYNNIQLTLDCGLSALVGRNGAGKSVFASQLVQQRPHECYLLPQLPPPDWQQQRIADVLGIADRLTALQQLAEGQCDGQTLSCIGDHWQLADDLQTELLSVHAPTDFWQRCNVLSGGQLNHLRLWWAFYQKQKLLILDEPSNHLDATGRRWLNQRITDYLMQPKSAILLISHDQDLLQRVSVLYELSATGLTRYGGNFTFYQQQRLLRHTALQQQRQHAERHLMQRQRQVQAADERAATRRQQGEKMRGSQASILLDYKKNRAQGATSARRTQEQQQLQQAQQQLQQIKAQQEVIKQQQFYLPSPQEHANKTLVNAINLQLRHGSSQQLSFNWRSNQRVHLQGNNGSGKSTLLRTLAGVIPAKAGQLQLNCTVQYLDQHFSLLDANQNALVNLRRYCPLLSETTARTLLASAGFRSDNALKPAGVLSGGERMKLAMLMVSQHSGCLLLLDEPDNHLDWDTKQLLAAALRHYPAGFVVVSHDRYFIDQLAISAVLQL